MQHPQQLAGTPHFKGGGQLEVGRIGHGGGSRMQTAQVGPALKMSDLPSGKLDLNSGVQTPERVVQLVRSVVQMIWVGCPSLLNVLT